MTTMTIDGKEYTLTSSEDNKLVFEPVKDDYGIQGFDDTKACYHIVGDGGLAWTSRLKQRYIEHFNTYPTKEMAREAAKYQRVHNAVVKAALLVGGAYPRNNLKQGIVLYYSDSWKVNGSGSGGLVMFKDRDTAYAARDLLNEWGVKPV